MNKSILGALALVIVIAAVGFAVLGGDDAEEVTTNNQTTTTSQTDAEDTSTDAEDTNEADEAETNETDDSTAQNDAADSEAISADEVALHNTATDCWTHISGQVYDITEYVPRHPGGESILAACGADGTSLFTQRTNSEGQTVGSGQPHSSSANSQLAGFLIGDLEQ